MKMNRMLVTGFISALGAGALLQSTPSMAAPTVASKSVGLDIVTDDPFPPSFTWTEFGGAVASGAMVSAVIGTPGAVAGAVAGGAAYVVETARQYFLVGSNEESE
jgi:hypothetical protein